MNSSIADNFKEIQARVEAIAKGRPVKIIAVSKTVSVERILEAHQAGIKIFGENRIQEALPKIQHLASVGMDWHFVGHLQTNKGRDAVRYFSCIHSVDSVKLMEHIENQAAKLQKEMTLLLEVNLGGEESKHGFAEDHLREGLNAAGDLKWSRVCGLMIIPPSFEDIERVRPFFRHVREIQQGFSAEFPELTELSMGMSHDYIVAVEEGATMVRIGTALFGPRRAR